MKRFELWLDESGDFSNDQRKVERNEKPSLVGGLLIENNTFADQEISMILPEAGTYHSVDMKDQLARFRKIDERLFRNPANRLVVFSNQECIMILDNNITYLNIISQGILQIQVDVGKAPLALVQMRGERRDDHQIASLIGQGGAVKHQTALAAGAIDQLPGAVRMPGNRIGEQTLACIGDLIHGHNTPVLFSGIVAKKVRFVHMKVR